MRAVRLAAASAVVLLVAGPSLAQEIELRLTAEAAPLYRADFSWTEAEPTWESVLEYEGMRAFDLAFEGEAILATETGNAFCLRGSYTQGWITSGETWDTDHFYDAMENESVAEISGEVQELSIGLGGRLALEGWFGSYPSYLTLRLGFSRTEHDLSDEDLHNTFPEEWWYPGDVSTYDAVWMGPFLGLELSLGLAEQLEVTAGVEGQLAYYEGLADWLLRDDFAHPSFEHTATGWGVAGRLGLSYQLSDWLTLGATGRVMAKWASDGESDTWLADGETIEINLEKVELQSSRLAFKVTVVL